jgi:hypothetical protein
LLNEAAPMTTVHPSIYHDELLMLDEYTEKVTATFGRQFEADRARLAGGNRLLSRFADAMSAVKTHGRTKFSAADEAHNELCIASALLSGRKTVFNSIAYEPPLTGTNETIDFVCKPEAGGTLYVDAKTIHPRLTDRWAHFEEVKRSQKLPANVNVVLSENWLGGELWHSMYNARSRMLEHALGFEAKIRAAKLAGPDSRFIMMFGGAGFHWHEDELEDFAFFYQTGQHYPGDPFAEMESWYVRHKGIKFDRTINAFGAMRRHQFDISHARINWNVVPPSSEDANDVE